MDGRRDGRTDGGTEGRREGQTDGRTDGRVIPFGNPWDHRSILLLFTTLFIIIRINSKFKNILKKSYFLKGFGGLDKGFDILTFIGKF